ncbi:hypothetical protein HKX48_006964 [Thoreauomyces humboldtii]|nr:hypothetical protein HKX48_006964 [Thoreauomyces humboldtii]
MPPKHHQAHITAVLRDPHVSSPTSPSSTTSSSTATSYEQRIGAARRRHSIKHDAADLPFFPPHAGGIADAAAGDEHDGEGVGNVPSTPTQVLSSLKDYDEFAKKEGERGRFTVGLTEMPDWYVDNMYLLRGYRRITNSYLGCIKSLSYLHNETGNVLSHAFGFAGFIVLAQVFYGWLTVETSTWADYLIMGTFFLGAVVCLGLSTTFHLCCCHSRGVAAIWLRGDYVGIVTLIMYGDDETSALISSGVIYFIGAVVYASRVPERWAPGKFDIWFHSHQIFHILVVAAAVVHYYGVVEQQRWWHTNNHQCALSPDQVVRTLLGKLYIP